jgi:hypothetical protein
MEFGFAKRQPFYILFFLRRKNSLLICKFILRLTTTSAAHLIQEACTYLCMHIGWTRISTRTAYGILKFDCIIVHRSLGLMSVTLVVIGLAESMIHIIGFTLCLRESRYAMCRVENKLTDMKMTLITSHIVFFIFCV